MNIKTSPFLGRFRAVFVILGIMKIVYIVLKLVRSHIKDDDSDDPKLFFAQKFANLINNT